MIHPSNVIPPMSGLGDFCLSVHGSPKPFADGLADQSRWPALGQWHAPVDSIELWPGAQLLVRGCGSVRTAGRAGAWLLSIDSDHRREPEAVVAKWLAPKASRTSPRLLDLSDVTARFVLIAWDAEDQTLVIATDAFRTYPVAHLTRRQSDSASFYAASDIRLLRRVYEAGEVDAQGPATNLVTDPKAIYHYLNFSFVPNEACIWRDMSKLAPGGLLRWSHETGAATLDSWWDARYPEDHSGNESAMSTELREQVMRSVHRYAQTDASHWGSFLSGGTDSSSISGILSAKRRELADQKVNSFSIGFAEPGYDELAYAKIASDHFG
ncbi:MAG: asparagine synthase-related protein, partial [Burkholderiaceae bacterium]